MILVAIFAVLFSQAIVGLDATAAPKADPMTNYEDQYPHPKK